MVSAKYDFFLSFFETIMGKSGISPEQKTIIDNCLHEMYRDFLLGDTTVMATLKDYYEILYKQQSEEAKPLYMSFELYVNGSMKAFSYSSNVNVSNCVAVYDMLDAGTKAQEILERVDVLSKSVNKDTLYVTVKPSGKVDFEKIGLDENRQYTIPEINAALAEADREFLKLTGGCRKST